MGKNDGLAAMSDASPDGSAEVDAIFAIADDQFPRKALPLP
jgi:hypothetical protein